MRGVNRWLRGRPAAIAAVAAGASLLVLGLRAAGLLVVLELLAYDRLSAPPGPRDDPPITLVEIREEDISRFGHPLCDRLLALGLQRLLDAGARAVGVDLYRDVPVEACGGSVAGLDGDDMSLAGVVTGTDRIVMVMKYGDPEAGGVPAAEFVQGTSRLAFSDVPVDVDGRVRRTLLIIDDDEQVYFSLSLRLALLALREEGLGLGPDPAGDETLMALGARTLPAFAANDGGYVGADDGGYQLMVDYSAGARPYPTLTMGDLLEGGFDPGLVRDRVVVVGTSAPSVKDIFFTTYSAHLPAHQAAVDGVVVHAHALANLLALARGERLPIRGPGDVVELLSVVLLALLGAVLGSMRRSAGIVLGSAVVGLLALVAASWWLLQGAYWLPVAGPGLAGGLAVAGAAALAAARERAERQEVRGLFSRFLRPAVAEEIWRQRDSFIGADGRPASHRIELTTLMSDIRGFSSASEKLEPERLMLWINEYLNAMAELVEDHGGVVDDYAGDGIKANFGFPIPARDAAELDDFAKRAVHCALAMGRRIQRLNADWLARGLPSGQTRIGIYTGPAVVGVIGSEESLKYTTVGDAVNTAARLESFDKDAFADAKTGPGWRILVGGETLDHLADVFRTEDLGFHEVKGKKRRVHIYRVLGERVPAEADREQEETR